MERSKAGTKKSPDGLYNNNKHNIVALYKLWKKYNEIQLTNNKMDLNFRKMTIHPPSPVRQEERNECGKKQWVRKNFRQPNCPVSREILRSPGFDFVLIAIKPNTIILTTGCCNQSYSSCKYMQSSIRQEVPFARYSVNIWFMYRVMHC